MTEGEIISAVLEAENLVIDLGAYRKSISFSLEAGSVVWIGGVSGSGKTSLLRTLARLQAPVSGEMRLEGKSWKLVPPEKWRTRVLYAHQKPVMFQASVASNLNMPFSLHCRHGNRLDLEKARIMLAELQIANLRDILDRDALTLSVGESARVALVRCLLVNPAVLLLDEITASLDADSRDAALGLLKRWVASQPRAIVGVSHDEHVKQMLPGPEILLSEPMVS
jgi:putative ABC transport system ATP-binding protein